MAGSAGSGKPRTGSDQSLGDLISLATKDMSQLVRYEINLAKSELRSDIRRVAASAVLGGIAAFFVLLVLGSGFFAYVYVLHEQAHLGGGLAAAYGVAAGTFFLFGVVAVLIAWRIIKRMTGSPRLPRTRKSIQEDISALRREGDSKDAIGAGTHDDIAELETAGHEPPR